MNQTTTTTLLAAWKAWQELCALDRCEPEAKQLLLAFAASRFKLYLGRYAGWNAAGWSPRMPEHESCWHFFESHVTVKSNRQGKRYKNWLFERAKHSRDAPLDVIQGGATLIMRDVVREFLRHESLPRGVSLPQAMLEECDLHVRRADVFAGRLDPESRAALKEYEALAQDHAETFFADMTLPLRVALLASSMGLPLSHDLVQQAAGRGKSALHAGFKDWLNHMAGLLQKQYQDDPHECRLTLALLVLERAQNLAKAWACEPASPAKVKALLAPGKTADALVTRTPRLISPEEKRNVATKA